MESWVGKRLGKVQIESLVGRGGAAEVYVGTHTTLGRKVAVKILRNISDETSDALERFEREARAVAQLRHPNIVQVHDFDTIDNNPYLVMEYISGPSLSKYLNALHQNKGRLPLQQAVRLIRAVASALQYAHNNRVIHRDVKPGNILLTSPSKLIEIGKPLPEDFEPVLTDFGLVRLMDQHRQTTTGHIAGTPAYMSPEQARGEATDGRGDIYSLGIVLYEILSGDVPFDGESTVSILLKQVTELHPRIPGLSPPLQNVLDRALAKNIKDRFQTAMEFAEALSAAADAHVDLHDYAPTMEFNELPTIPPSANLHPVEAEPSVKAEEPVKAVQPLKPRTGWLRIALPATLVVAAGVFFFINRSPFGLAENTPTASFTMNAITNTDTGIPGTPTATQTPTARTGPVGFLQFQNANALADQVALIVEAMPVPPPGSQYQVWLTGGDEHISVGTFSPDKNGKAQLTFSDPNAVNLFSRYGGVEVTLEFVPDPDPELAGPVLYSFTLPKDSLVHLRYLLASFSRTPDKSGLAQGLYANVKQINELAKEMQSASDSGDQKLVLQKAETALNILVGGKSADYKDWNGDGLIDPRKSYGLLMNGDEYGYIQAVQVEADYIITNTSGAAQYTYMIANGKAVKTCAQNMSQWTPELRALLLAIINATSDPSRSEAIRNLTALTEQLLNGIDADKNGTVDTTTGECGAQTAYEYAYRMADMPILPAGLTDDQLTQVAFTFVPTRGTQINGGTLVGTPAGTAINTKKPTNTPRPVPTQKPKPTKDPGGGGGGGKPPTKPPKK